MKKGETDTVDPALFADDPDWAACVPEMPSGGRKCGLPDHSDCSPLDIERVSMNLWGFTPELFAALEARFPAWLEKNGTAPKSEWYIPFVVDELIHEGKADVAVLPTDSNWFGVTYREDKPFVTAEIGKLVAAGEYPVKLLK